jgi:hypothetical protein
LLRQIILENVPQNQAARERKINKEEIMEMFFIYSADLFILSDLLNKRRMQKPNQEIIMLKWILKKSIDLFLSRIKLFDLFLFRIKS